MEQQTAKIIKRLTSDGWYLSRNGANHDIYRHPEIEGIVTVPRHRKVTPGVWKSIAKKAGWPE
ncbi:type II toxin-antitoxin system HicA family toxin [Martelella mangrovi]|uniref:RNA binding protein YcfA (HicA-like mRNA interferase family) n=1 Tax=Martelella mangrovi TaxID=1397477 RepID=A0ABV2IH81_9HYPH